MLLKLFKSNFLKVVLVFFLASLFFVFHDVIAQSQSSDAIAIRILPNQKHYSITRWYKNYFGASGAPQLSTVDGYEAIRDGRSVYVNVSNVNSSNVLYTNIYLISFNQEAENATIDIFSKILANWKFNTNKTVYGLCREDNSISCLSDDDCPIGDYCTSAKARIVRDTKRLSDISEIKVLLDEYKAKTGTYPVLGSGTYSPNTTVSAWPSWRGDFSEVFGATLPIDPVNKLGACPGFDEKTCWDENTLSFSNTLPDLPKNSLVYFYSTDSSGSSINVCAVFESGLVISGGANIGTCSKYCLDFDGDGFGSPASTACPSLGYDCNDADPSVTTGTPEDCSNGSDDDCDGYIDCYDVVDCGSDPACLGTVVCNDNGVCDPGETCAGCPMDNCCACGDGVCDTGAGECSTCYGPSLDCYCGDNALCAGVESCDDGNTTPGDGCNATCQIEPSTCVDKDGDGYNKIDTSCPSGNDCDDDPSKCGANCYPGKKEICDGYDNNCDTFVDNDSSITADNCKDVCMALSLSNNFNSSRVGTYKCCGNDSVEGNPYQAIESSCVDGQDNDCDGLVDLADSDCSGFCADSGEDNFTNATTPGVCNQCGNSVDNDGDQPGNWTPYGNMVDKCDSDCGSVTTTIQLSEYEDGNEISCDGIDNNCDGNIDEGVMNTFYLDSDRDGHGNALMATTTCTAPPGYVTNSDDCDDTDINIHPGALEICDGIDNNCSDPDHTDGVNPADIDEGVTSTFYKDSDGDSHGNALMATTTCTASPGYVASSDDCDDTDINIHPGASEICNNTVDEDCDTVLDNGCIPCYYDGDGDGYGDANNSTLRKVCSGVWVNDKTDCDDSANYINPGHAETCDGYDNNCSDPDHTGTINPAEIDEGCDGDGDGYCNKAMDMYNSNLMCTNTTIYTFPADNGSPGDDCDDTDPSIHPGADEICGDGIDQNCVGGDLSCVGICTDSDGDREIKEATNISLCGPVCGVSGTEACLSNNDCDDTDSTNFHRNGEICDDGKDNNCNGDVDCHDSDCPSCPNQCIFSPNSFPLSCNFTL